MVKIPQHNFKNEPISCSISRDVQGCPIQTILRVAGNSSISGSVPIGRMPRVWSVVHNGSSCPSVAFEGQSVISVSYICFFISAVFLSQFLYPVGHSAWPSAGRTYLSTISRLTICLSTVITFEKPPESSDGSVILVHTTSIQRLEKPTSFCGRCSVALKKYSTGHVLFRLSLTGQ